MTAPGTRYSDVDLRVDPRLIGAAVTYAQTYPGDWDYMVACRDLALEQGNLPLPIARAVLNVARCDPRWAGYLPVPRSRSHTGPFPPMPGRPEPFDPPEELPGATTTHWDDDEDDEEPDWRMPFDLPTNWKRTVGIAPGFGQRSQARTWHTLDTERSTIRVYPMAPPESRYQTRIYWLCGSTASQQLLEVPPADLPECRSCIRVKRERSERDATGI